MLADAARLHVVLRRARELHAVQQEQILLRPVPLHREVVTAGRVRHTDAAGFLPGEIDHSGIQGEEFVVTSPVEWEVFDLLLANQTRDALRRHTHLRRVPVHGDFLAGLAHRQFHIHRGALAHSQVNAGAHLFLEPGPRTPHLILPDRQREELVMAFSVGHGAADRPCVYVLCRYGCPGKGRAGRIGDRSRKSGGDLSICRCRNQNRKHHGRSESHSEGPPQQRNRTVFCGPAPGGDRRLDGGRPSCPVTNSVYRKRDRRGAAGSLSLTLG